MKQVQDQQTVFGTREWAKYNENLINGCSHDCRYCYAKTMAMRFHRHSADSWQQETVNEEKLSKVFRKRNGRIMFPTSHDITPSNLDDNLTFLSNMLKPGNEVLIVSKPHLECIKAICKRCHPYRQNILFRFTIGSADNKTLKFWDRNAPNFDERLECLMYAHKSGFQTSISCEPMLDDKANELIAEVLPFVTDAIWLGKGNLMTTRLKMNAYGDKETLRRYRQLDESQPESYIFNLYAKFKDNPKIKWKDSIKKIVGIETPTKSGMDI